MFSRWWFQILFIFTPKFGEDFSHFDLRIFFRMGGLKNHQLVFWDSELFVPYHNFNKSFIGGKRGALVVDPHFS